MSRLCFNTVPLSFDVFSSYPTFTLNPIPSSSDFACSSVFPITLVIVICLIPVPLLTCIFTESPAETSVFSAVSWLITYPSWTFLLVSSTTSAFKFASSNAWIASSCAIPTTFGTVAFSVPLLITTFTVLPCFTEWYFSKYAGSWLIICPSSTSLLYSSLSTSYFNLASSICFCASSFVNPTTFGKSTSFGFVIFSTIIVPPNARKNSSIIPITILSFLCSFIQPLRPFSAFSCLFLWFVVFS